MMRILEQLPMETRESSCNAFVGASLKPRRNGYDRQDKKK
jgi:hypothetical protein